MRRLALVVAPLLLLSLFAVWGTDGSRGQEDGTPMATPPAEDCAPDPDPGSPEPTQVATPEPPRFFGVTKMLDAHGVPRGTPTDAEVRLSRFTLEPYAHIEGCISGLMIVHVEAGWVTLRVDSGTAVGIPGAGRNAIDGYKCDQTPGNCHFTADSGEIVLTAGDTVYLDNVAHTFDTVYLGPSGTPFVADATPVVADGAVLLIAAYSEDIVEICGGTRCWSYP